MASTYVNDLRLNEMATGDQSGSWGTVTNTNLELIGEAFSYGTEAITTNADTHTTTIADGASDPGRAMFLKYTGSLDSACTITIGPNTVSKMWFIENATSGSQNIIISQGSGANVTIAAGQTKAVYSDGAGAGAAFVDAFDSLSVGTLTSDNIGIGTSSPSGAKLHISDNAAVSGVKISNTGTSGRSYLMQTTSASAGIGGGYFVITDDGAGADRLVIDSSGNVGINTSSAVPLDANAQLLAIHGDAAGAERAQIKLTTTTSGQAAGDGFYIAVDDSAAYISQRENQPLVFSTNATEAARLDASGNLLVGQTSANSFNLTSGFGFDVRQAYGLGVAVQDNPTAIFNRTNSDGTIAEFRKDGTTVGSIDAVSSIPVFNTSTSTGALGVGGTRVYQWDSNQFYPLVDDAKGVGSASYRFRDAHFSGTVNAANFNTTSDATLKTNVETLTGSLDAVKSLRGVSFDWIENGGSEVGVIAQEVEAVLPDVVSTNDQGIKSVKYGNMVALLIEAMKEQQAQIDELKAKLGE